MRNFGGSVWALFKVVESFRASDTLALNPRRTFQGNFLSWGGSSMVECLASIHRALGSIPINSTNWEY